MPWPIYFKDNLIIGNPESQVGICALWSEKNSFVQDMDKNKFSLCGNLYTTEGINYIVKNILANPRIRHIFLCGADLMKSGDALMNFLEKGVDENGKIHDSRGFISKSIKNEFLKNFRKNVKVIDLRGKEEKLKNEIAKLAPRKPALFCKPIYLKNEMESAREIYSEEQSYVLRGASVGELWPRILDVIMKFGELKDSEYKLKQKEILNLIAVVENSNQDETDENLCALRISEEDLKNYYEKFFGDPKSFGVHYTYGDRLVNYKLDSVNEGEGLNQIKKAVEYLKQTPHSRRAQATIWDFKLDQGAASPPCLTQLNWLIKFGKLYQTVIIRSNDMFGAWPLNALALKKLQNEIAKELNVPLGSLTMISISAHIYENNWEEARIVIEQNLENKILALAPDKNGYFLIKTENNEIITEHHLADGRKSDYMFRGKNAQILYRQILNENLVSLLDHAAYLGAELRRAEECLKAGKTFVQDKQ